MDSLSSSRRAGPDRRRRSFGGSIKGLFLARRRSRRRLTDARAYVDRFRGRDLLWALGIPLFSAIDCFWTLQILNAGGSEVNPVMRALLEYDVQVFTAIKMLMTGMCVLFLLAHGHLRVFRWLRVEHVMYLLLFGYMALFTYEVHLVNLAWSAT